MLDLISPYTRFVAVPSLSFFFLLRLLCAHMLPHRSPFMESPPPQGQLGNSKVKSQPAFVPLSSKDKNIKYPPPSVFPPPNK